LRGCGIVACENANLVVDGGTIIECGIMAHNGAAVKVSGLRIVKCKEAGLVVNRTGIAEFENCVIEGNGRSGAEIVEVQNISFKMSMFASDEKCGLMVRKSNVAISGGNFLNNLFSGICGRRATVKVIGSRFTGNVHGGV
jgi:hypothetical protein